MPSKALFPVIALVSLLSQRCYAQDRCVSDFSGKREKSLRSTKLVKPQVYVDLYFTPHVQFMWWLTPRAVADITYGGSIGIKFPSKLAIDVGASHYQTDREFDDQFHKYNVDADFFEINAQLKYYFVRKRNLSWYPMLTFTTNFDRVNEPIPWTDGGWGVGQDERFYFHHFYIGFGAGIEKGITKWLAVYAEPSIRIRSVPWWSIITYNYSIRVSAGVRVRI